jgi:hypothetical protein
LGTKFRPRETRSDDGSKVDSEPARANVYLKAQRRVIRRDAATENTAKTRLARPRLSRRSASTHGLLPAERMASGAHLTQEGWCFEADGSPIAPRAGCGSKSVQASIGSNSAARGVWRQPRVAAKTAARNQAGRTNGTLDDGSTGIIPEEWGEVSPARQSRRASGSICASHPAASELLALLADEPKSKSMICSHVRQVRRFCRRPGRSVGGVSRQLHVISAMASIG